MASKNECVICCKDIEIFAVGECNHAVCYNCMTRIRGLINQSDCPICRKSLDTVIMSPQNIPYSELVKDLGKYEYNDYYKTYFVNSECQKKFANLLANKCNLCTDRVFTTFEALRMHIRKQHDLFFCDLCVTHIKLFPWERQLYTKTEIATHRRIGDKNVSSHKGHPLCEYCDTRFFDKDALYKHLRTEHYFCHICQDTEGSNDFYEDIVSLRKHFKANHFVCEEGNCVNEDFTSVFRSEIDLKGHKAIHHSRTMSKMESKSVRNLDLNFAAMPRGKSKNNQQSTNNEQYDEPIPEIKKPINPMNEQDFPMLSSNGASSSFSAPPKVTVANKIGKAGLARTDENFPSLGPSSSGPLTMSKTTKPIAKTNIAHALKPNPASRSHTDTKNVQTNKKDIKKTNLQNHNTDKKNLFEDFPSLPATKNLQKVLKLPAQSKGVAATNLIEYSTLAKTEPKLRLVNTEAVSKPKEKPKPLSLNINSDLNFPSLGNVKQLDNPMSITGVREPKLTTLLTNNKPSKNKMNAKHLRNKNEEVTNNYTVLSGTLSHTPQYIRPPNEDNRNKELKRKLSTTLRDLDSFNEFQLASKMYINNKYTADTYFEHCRMVLGENFNSLFPELLVLLPNAERQKALYDVLCMSDNVSRKIFSRIKCCSTCGQVLLSDPKLNEVGYHERMHAAFTPI
ncbi:E3 ubiquitin-protein ligase ZNF598 [Culicoides brevitarsis]|uniref:E3 ubiquitin-protein ligase ZNF598 n=1 Tax=Culicoides brevitarsis TaxID=469753 RepID=UPI00307BA5FA